MREIGPAAEGRVQLSGGRGDIWGSSGITGWGEASLPGNVIRRGVG